MALSASLYRAWLKRLRTERKAKHKLVDMHTGGRCCLGHLAVAAGFTPDRHGYINYCQGILDTDICRKINLPFDVQRPLSITNDNTKGFGKVIEQIKAMRKRGAL